MQRLILAVLAALPLLIPVTARAQGARADSLPGPLVGFGVAPLAVPRHPALAPGGRLGPRRSPDAVADAWVAELRVWLAAARAGWRADTAVGGLFAIVPRPDAGLAPPTTATTSPFGPYADLGMQLNLRLELKADQFRNLRCTPQEQQNTLSGCDPGFPTITPDPQYSIRTAGVVGRRLHINVDFDSQREFDANNNLQVWYEGLEDEVLQRVEAGNVTFQAPASRFISAAIPANNFGVQAVGQLGPLELRGIYAQQKGNVVRDRFYSVGEVTSQSVDREARDLDYAAGRLFFALDPELLPGYPAVDILNLGTVAIPDSVRVGSLRVYRVRVVAPGTSNNQNIGGVRAVACAPTTDTGGCAAQRAGPFQWEVLQEGRDFYVDPTGAWFALTSPLAADDYLAVSYVPAGQQACGAPFRCIGTFPTVGSPDTSVVDTLRLVYDPKTGVTSATPSFRFELRNAYRVGGQEITRQTVEVALTVNQREQSGSANDTYLALLGLAVTSDPNRFDQYNRLFPRELDPGQGAPLRDYFIVFPHLTPFGDTVRLAASERNDSLYRTPRGLLSTQGPSSVFALRIRASVASSADRSALALNSIEIREGSEKLFLGNRLLQRGTDYSIDYTTGQVTFLQPDSLFFGGLGQIRAQFEERSAFEIAPTSIYGAAARYDLGERGSVSFTSLFQRERSAFTRPPLGFEPSSSFIGGVSADLRFEPQWISRALAGLPGAAGGSFLTVAGEVAYSKPTPNQAGQAYLEEFEAEAGRFVPLTESQWRWGSRPSSARGAEAFGISAFGFDPAEAVALTWQNVPFNPNGQPVEFLPQQIDPTIRVTGTAQNAEPVLWLLLKPDTVLGLANVNTGEPNWVRPPQFAPRWRSITLPLAAGGLDLSRVEFLEFWVWEDNQRVARENRAGLLIDIGSMFEDALAWVPDSFTVAGGDTTYHGQRYVGQGRLDTERDPVTRSWNAAINDEGFLTDRVVDGIYDAGAGAVIDTLPLCSATAAGRSVAYGFGDLRSRCGRDNGFVDTEDQDGDFVLDSAAGVRPTEDFVRFVFPFGDERYFVREGGQIPVTDSLGNPAGSAGWRLYRIPFRFDTLQVGTPNLRQAQAIRLTIAVPQTTPFGVPDPQIYFGLSRVRLVGATWLKRTDTPQQGLAGAEGTGIGEVAVTVVSTEDVQLGYVPPPGVTDEADRRDAGLQIGTEQINEKSLRLLARDLDVGERAEAYVRFTTEGDKNFLRYRTLRVWARGRGPGWDDGDLEFYIKAAKNEHNFYLYRTPARTVAWEPEVVVQLQRWLVLRAEIEQAWLSGAPPQVFPGCPDSTFLPPADSAYVRCDGPYVAYVRNPGTAPPNLAQVQELAVGMMRVSQRVFIDVAEVWVDDIRLGDVVDDVGLAGALDVTLSAANVADFSLSVTRRDGQFRQLGEDPSYVTNDALAAAGTVRLERFLPVAWGLALPVTARVVTSSANPFYLNRTDVRADVLEGLRTPTSRAESYAASLRRVRRSTHWLGRWLLDPVGLSGSYTRGTSRSEYADVRSTGYAANLDYVAIPTALRVAVAGVPLRLTPTSVRFRSGLSGGDADRSTFQVPVALATDSLVVPQRSTTRLWRSSAGFDMLPLTGLQLRIDGAWLRDLRDYGDSTSMGRVVGTEQETLFGLNAGFEAQRSLTSLVNATTEVWGVLRPRATLATTFQLTRDPNAPQPVRAEGDSAGEFRIPTSFNNNRRTDLGLQIDLRRAGSRLFGDSATGARIARLLQPIDISFGRTVASVYSRTGIDPSTGYAFAITGFDAFRQQDGVPAQSASDVRNLGARGGANLPLGLRLGLEYQWSRGETWTIRTGEQVPIRTRSRLWPGGNVGWTHSPRRLLGGLLSSISAQASYRESQGATEQPRFGSGATETSVTSTADRTFAPSVALAWRIGLLTTFDATATRNEQSQAGTRYLTDIDVRNANIAFTLTPEFLPLPSGIRTNARFSQNGTTRCIQSPGQTVCVPYVDSRQTSTQLTMDTDLPPSLGAGLQVAYLINEERQTNRKTSQFVITAFVSFSTSVGQLR